MALLYEQLADMIERHIDTRIYPAGSRMPSIRAQSEKSNVSLSTSVRAYRELERRGRIEARPRIGFFVANRVPELDLPAVAPISERPVPVSERARILRLLEAATDPSIINFGAATPYPDLMPGVELERSSRRVWREHRRRCLRQEFPPGTLELRSQIARRLVKAHCTISPEDIVITNGANDAQALALQLLTEPGDVVAVESPTSYGLLNIIEQLGLRALEIPTDPQRGISIEALEFAFQQWNVKACVVIPNFSNPLGISLSDKRKQKLLKLAAHYDVAIVEDDIYGELPLKGTRQRPLKSWDRHGLVYYCSSVTKTISPGLRIGWLAPPQSAREKARYHQYVRSVSVQTHGQLCLADYLGRRNVDRHLRWISSEYAHKTAHLANLVETLFPPDTRISRPLGGFVLWVELGNEVNTTELMNVALNQGISFAPGALFSAEGRFSNCLRLNSAVTWAPKTERALAGLARLLF